ncbi:MAG: FlgN [Rhodocyclaceae bacterium]|nr:FlgN [Rhodocyclaceae bacterium]
MPALADLLAQELDLVRAFIAELNSEQDALKSGDTDSLAPITQRKSQLVEQLNAAENDRNLFLQRAGHTGDRSGMQAWLAKNPGDRAAATQWAELMKLASMARQINDFNGRLIAMRLQATSQALAILTQQSQRPTLYGANGLTAAGTGSRLIDAA